MSQPPPILPYRGPVPRASPLSVPPQPVLPIQPTPVLPYAGPLSPEHYQQLSAAAPRMRKVRRASSVAYTDGCILAVCAAATLGFGFTELSSVLTAVFLGAIAAVELWGAQSLRKLDVNAPKRLGINQLVLAGAITLWALWGVYSELSHHTSASEIAQYAPELDANFGQMATNISVIVYLGIIAATILFQGGMALYYFSRRRALAQYVEETPPWIIEMQKNGVSL